MNRYLGGIQRGGQIDAGWQARGQEQQLFLDAQGDAFITHQEDDLSLLIRGLARFDDGVPVVAEILRRYRQTGSLPVERLEGSFTLALLDAARQRVVLYRNLVGNGFTYYTRVRDGFLFASNLAELVARVPSAAQVNEEALPAYFLFRFVPGQQTLFRDCYRLQPGEEVIFEAGHVQRRQRQTFADLRGQEASANDPVERLEATMAGVLKDQSAHCPKTANLLSGGIDSTYLQAVWNQACGKPMASFSVSVDHPRTRPDTEYALSAALALGARHTLVPADGPYIDYLVESLAATAEPPNHAFAVYFSRLARAMAAAGVPTALCGEGADSLFGTGLADVVRHARWLRLLVPGQKLRQWCGRLADQRGRDCLAAAFRLAEHVDQPGHWEHPLNRMAVFTDWDLAQAAFGDDRINAALIDRRSLLDQCDVGDDPLERVHGVGYLGEAVDSASLWTTYFNQAGGDLCCPFLDSRLLGFSLNLPSALRFPYRRPKGLLKEALARHVPPAIVQRGKLGFGQPIFEWLSPGGPLRGWAERIRQYDCIPATVRASALARPGWFLYSLLCFDLWHQLFIDRTLDLTSWETASRSTTSRFAPAGLGVALS